MSSSRPNQTAKAIFRALTKPSEKPCAMCRIGARELGLSYCTPCRRKYRRERARELRGGNPATPATPPPPPRASVPGTD
jgi:hypothetical protein